MKITVQLLEEKGEVVKELSGRISKACDTLQAMHPEQLKQARRAYLANLSKEQGSLIQKLTGATSWSELVTALDVADRFVSEVDNVTLDPARTELLGCLKTWMQEIGVSTSHEAEDWFYNSLSGAGQTSLREINVKLESLQGFSRLLTDPMVAFFRKVVSNELGQLRNLERNMENVSMWMDRATQAILQGIELQKIVTSVKESIGAQYKTTPKREIVSKFLGVAESLIDHVGSQVTNFEKAHESWRQTKEIIEREWKLLTPRLDTISQQHEALISSARPLVTKEVSEWGIKALNDIAPCLDDLSAIVGEVVQSQDSVGDIEAHVSSLTQDYPSVPGELVQLRDGITQLREVATKIKLSSTLADCRDSLKKLNHAYQRWQQEVEQACSQWVGEAKSWVNISKKERTKIAPKLEEKVKTLEVLTISKEPFGKIVSLCIEVARLTDESRKELHDKITGDQLKLLDAVTSLEAKKGSVNISDMEEEFGKLSTKHFADLLNLSRKQLLSLRISAREEHFGS